ncbi:MAG: methyltransferase domain-containing protein [Alphaproteobacteria bacterium]|nr:methyltransferase domain-containing protein [Alphaproteobacteria bacterium]MBU0859317.1 methyltransferase domain-containing protein [Alphaproteobacteria bacterium]
MTRIVTLKAVRDDYADLAPVYDRQWSGFNRAVRNWVMDRFPDRLPGGAQILDTGCGTGHMLADIAQAYPAHKLHGIDLSPAMLDQARQKLPYATLTEADLAHHNLPPHTYDVVLSLNVLHHMNDPARYLAALVSSCTLGGTIFLCDFAVEGFSMKLAEKHWRRFNPSHSRAFSLAEMQAMLAGLPVTIIDQGLLRPDIFWRLQIYQLRREA